MGSEPLFSGAPTTPPPEVFARARRSNPVWLQVLERGLEDFAKRPENAGIYPDPSAGGATIQQQWMMFTLFGIEPYCLLARPLPPSRTQRITRLVDCTPAELVDALRTIEAAEGELNVPLAYHDGTTGHCIRLTAYDAARDRFIYHDPWPERSLLAKENNAAGVDAKEEGKRWSVTAEELERVVFAAFVFAAQWARVQGQSFDLDVTQWAKSEFFEHFRLHQLDERAEDGNVARLFAPGAFREQIGLEVESRPKGKIVRASLAMERKFVIDNLTLALDLAKSFVLSFAPPPDRAIYEEIASALWALRDPRRLLQAKDAKRDESEAIRCIHAFMGSGEAHVDTDFGALTVGTVVRDGRQLQGLEFELQ